MTQQETDKPPIPPVGEGAYSSIWTEVQIDERAWGASASADEREAVA